MTPWERQAFIDELAARYGQWVQDVGAEDGTEDEFGDLCSEVYAQFGGDHEDNPAWQHFLDVATGNRATTWDAWLAPLEATITTYGGKQ